MNITVTPTNYTCIYTVLSITYMYKYILLLFIVLFCQLHSVTLLFLCVFIIIYVSIIYYIHICMYI